MFAISKIKAWFTGSPTPSPLLYMRLGPEGRDVDSNPLMVSAFDILYFQDFMLSTISCNSLHGIAFITTLVGGNTSKQRFPAWLSLASHKFGCHLQTRLLSQ